MALFRRKMNRGMQKTRDNFSGNLDNVLGSFESIDEDLYEELVEVLVMSDVGVMTSEQIVEETKDRVKSAGISNPAEVREVIKQVVSDMLGKDETIDFLTTPAVILVIGVNGVGKTTTIGKMAHYFESTGRKVILGAADTFRAAAIDQLQIWADRAGVDMVKHDEGADPAAVVFDTIHAGINRGADVIICDTAGRIHNKKNLMAELGKIYKVIDRELPYSDREIFLVLDATTGQNAISQAKEFMAVCEVSGIVLTKLDGTARGGVVLSIKNDLKLPVKFIGLGEGIDDLQPFKAESFAASLFEPLAEEQENLINEALSENLQMSENPDYLSEEAIAERKAMEEAARIAAAEEEAANSALLEGIDLSDKEPEEVVLLQEAAKQVRSLHKFAETRDLSKNERRALARSEALLTDAGADIDMILGTDVSAAKAAAAAALTGAAGAAEQTANQKAADAAAARKAEQKKAEEARKAAAAREREAEKARAEEQARQRAEVQARREAEDAARAEAAAAAEAKAKAEAEARAQAEAEAKAAEEARLAAEAQAKAEAEEAARVAAEQEAAAKAEAEAQARAEAEARAAEEALLAAEAQAKAEAEEAARVAAEQEAAAKAEAEAQARAEAEARAAEDARLAAEAQAKAKAAEEARLAAEAQAKAEAEARAAEEARLAAEAEARIAEEAAAQAAAPAIDPALLEELNAKAAEYRKQIADAEAAMAATWNPAMKQRLQERIDATKAKLAALER
ncbi:MAG: signal recognition particle-docking protein FtsY [Clostridia bacterium]|nr:signal recognition particle-docking protein FtsY [Clostridia bacterium]